MEQYSIRQLEKADLPALNQMVADVVAWMGATGSIQWDNTYPTPAIFAADQQNRGLYGLFVGDKLCGCLVLDQNRPREYDGINWAYDGPLFYLHRVALHPACHGMGYGKILLNFAGEKAKTLGGSAIQSDTAQSNAVMRANFLAAGWRAADPLFHLDVAADLGFFCPFERRL